MASSRPSRPLRRSLAAIALVAIGAAPAPHDVASVTLAQPFEIVPRAAAPLGMKSKLDALAHLDPADPTRDDSAGQTLSLFGREDLIARDSRDYAPSACTAVPGSSDVLDEIVRRARQTSIVIVSESHQRSEHRGFTAEIAARLRPLGYDSFAAETLANPQAGMATRFVPSFVTRPAQPYLEDGDGHYLSEAGFGRLTRRVKALGYRPVPYEITYDKLLAGRAAGGDQVALREEAQAQNLAGFMKAHPGARMLVHVGYSHAAEVPRANGERWMAARLRQKTGIDPLTVSQTTCRGGAGARRLSALPADQPAGTFDLIVDHPVATFTRGRPDWRVRAGDRAVAIPPALRPASGWRVIEARPVGEPVTSVPLDRVAIRAGEDVALMLPPGRYRLRAIEVGYLPPDA